jgi:hypothetical protein
VKDYIELGNGELRFRICDSHVRSMWGAKFAITERHRAYLGACDEGWAPLAERTGEPTFSYS